MSADLLERLGRPFEEIVHLDFETYYSADYSLTKCTTEAYVRDERFEVLGVGVRVGRGQRHWLEEWEFRRWSDRVDWSRCAVDAHHAQFDAFILSERYSIVPAFIFCTMSMGRALHGQGALEDLAPRYGLGTKGDLVKSNALKGKRRSQITQRQWRELGDYCVNDVFLGSELLYAMAPEFPTLELWVVDSTVRMFTEPVFTANGEVLEKALADEKRKKAEMLARVAGLTGEDPKTVLGSTDKFSALLTGLGVPVPLKPNTKGEMIPAFAKDDPGMAGLLEHDREDVRLLAEARLSVKSTIVETRVERLIGITKRGTVPFYLKYCGAHTHRWSGGDKMNPQNFNRGGSLRDAIEAPPGWLIVAADSGQIEARVLPWISGERGLLETFRRNDTTGGDFYSDVGSTFFLKKISKKETPIERQLSKNMILGLGFNMGWGVFGLNLLKGMLGADPVQFTLSEAAKFNVDVMEFQSRPFGRREDGISCGYKTNELRERMGVRLSFKDLLIHCAVAAHFVGLYRRTYPKIKALWRSCEDVIELMAQPGLDDVVRMTFGCFKVIRQGIVKPNGLVLRYPGLRRGPHGWTYMGGDSGRERVKIYGGLLTENLVQSIARDIVAEQAMRVRADGYKLGTTTHDEVVAVTPEPEALRALERMIAHMRQPPTWCADLPLNAEGGYARSYGAIK